VKALLVTALMFLACVTVDALDRRWGWVAFETVVAVFVIGCVKGDLRPVARTLRRRR
jgi:hypothetical protein